MNDVSSTVATGLIASYQEGVQRIHTLADSLSEADFWAKPYPYGNSFGTLALHLAGNLNHYIGAHIAQTGYVRDRALEFTARHEGEKAQVLSRLDDAVAMVADTLRQQTEQDWEREYVGFGDTAMNRLGLFMRCSTHVHHHLGQMIYLVKAIQTAG